MGSAAKAFLCSDVEKSHFASLVGDAMISATLHGIPWLEIGNHIKAVDGDSYGSRVDDFSSDYDSTHSR